MMAKPLSLLLLIVITYTTMLSLQFQEIKTQQCY